MSDLKIDDFPTKPATVNTAAGDLQNAAITAAQIDASKDNSVDWGRVQETLNAVASKVPAPNSYYDKTGKPAKELFIKQGITTAAATAGCIGALMGTAASAGAAAPTLAVCGAALRQLFQMYKLFTDLFAKLKERAEMYAKISEQLPISTYACKCNKDDNKRTLFAYAKGDCDCSTGAARYRRLLSSMSNIDGIRAMTFVMYTTCVMRKLGRIDSQKELVFKDESWPSWDKMRAAIKDDSVFKYNLGVAVGNGWIDGAGANPKDLHFYSEFYINISKALNSPVMIFKDDPDPDIRKGDGEWFCLQGCFDNAVYLFNENKLSDEEMGFWDLLYKGAVITGGLNFNMIYREECNKVIGLAVLSRAKKVQQKKDERQKTNYLMYFLIAAALIFLIWYFLKK